MNKYYAYLMLVLALFLQGCMTPQEEYAHQQRIEYQQRQTAETERRALENKCAGYGFNRGSNSFAQCIQQEEIRERLRISKEECLENARERLCHLGCLGGRGNAIMACSQNCSERERVNAAACNGVYIPPPQQINIQQGGGDPNPFQNMNKCIKDGGTLMCR